jgi:hypothetical protein
VRPDQYVAHVLPLGGHAQLAAFFDAFMTRPASEKVGERRASAALLE